MAVVCLGSAFRSALDTGRSVCVIIGINSYVGTAVVAVRRAVCAVLRIFSLFNHRNGSGQLLNNVCIYRYSLCRPVGIVSGYKQHGGRVKGVNGDPIALNRVVDRIKRAVKEYLVYAYLAYVGAFRPLKADPCGTVYIGGAARVVQKFILGKVSHIYTRGQLTTQRGKFIYPVLFNFYLCSLGYVVVVSGNLYVLIVVFGNKVNHFFVVVYAELVNPNRSLCAYAVINRYAHARKGFGVGFLNIRPRKTNRNAAFICGNYNILGCCALFGVAAYKEAYPYSYGAVGFNPEFKAVALAVGSAFAEGGAP